MQNEKPTLPGIISWIFFLKPEYIGIFSILYDWNTFYISTYEIHKSE